MVAEPHLTRYVSEGVTLWGDIRRPYGVTLAFSERTGGVSQAPYASLNLGDKVGDEDAAVQTNRARLLRAMELQEVADRLVNPLQVHGARVVRVTSGDEQALAEARRDAREGADAVVCTVPDVPVLLLSADCVLVVLVAPGGFAVAHSGWPGTIQFVAAHALEALVEETGCSPEQVLCYLGPHVRRDDYEVSADLAERFVQAFGPEVAPDGRHLDLGLAIRQSLVERGVPAEAMCDTLPSTASCTQRFYSYRAEGGTCGRHGAICVMHGSEGVA